MVVSIILSILKVIGIVLLCILGLLLLVVLAVLFVPIRYKVWADTNINDEDKEYHVKLKVSWLLCFVRGKFIYPEGKGFILKIGPITVIGKEKKAKNQKRRKSDSKNNVYINENSVTEVENTSDEDIDKEENKECHDKIRDYELLNELLEEENNRKSKSLKEKIVYTWQKICDKIKEIWNKIKNIFKNIKKYIDIIKSDEFTSSFDLCKISLGRIFRMIKPRKVKINGTIGFKNPEQTGYMCALVGVLSPIYKKQLYITPDFENFIINSEILIKGRIYIFVIVKIAIKAFFDKNIRKVLEMFRKEVA